MERNYFVEVLTGVAIFIILILLVRLYAKESGVMSEISEAIAEVGETDGGNEPAPKEGEE